MATGGPNFSRGSYVMFAWISVFVVVTLISGLVGLTGRVHVATSMAEFLFFGFLLLMVMALASAILKQRPSLEAAEPHAKNKA